MFEGLRYFIDAIIGFLTVGSIFNILWSTLLGIIIGMLPGLTATLGVALLTTLTLGMAPDTAILILICIYVGAIYGGSRSAILLNIPGTPASAATTLDGFPLAQKGLAGRAMGIATSGSVLGTIIGMFFLATVSPLLAEAALEFQSYELFWLALFGVIICGQLTSFGSPLKGWIAGFLGLLVAMVGQETIYAFPRFSYGNLNLAGGFGLLPVLVGLFGFAEILGVMKRPVYGAMKDAADSVIPHIKDVLRHWGTIIRSGIVGTIIGIIPGAGEDLGAWVSYGLARGFSKNKEEYGKGSIEGLMAAETGDNAATPGAIIPVLTLAIPGSAPAAVLLAALFIHGVQPGPMLMIQNPGYVYKITAMMFFATLGILLFGLILTKPLLVILRVPRDRLMPIIFVLCVIGSFAIASRVFDIWVMLGFGILGFILRELKFPMAPLILGVVLGPILDINLRRGLLLADGGLAPFFTRPISMGLWISIILTFLLGAPWFINFVKRLGRGISSAEKREK